MTVVGEAVLDVVPGTQQFGPLLTEQVKPAAEEAGKAGGEELGKSMSDTLAKTLPLAGIAAAFTDAASEFNAGSRAIRTDTGLTGDALEELVENMRNVGRSGVTTGLGEVGEVIGAIKQRVDDLRGEPLEDLTKQIVQLAELTGGDASESVEGIIDLFTLWTVATENQAATLDLIWTASQRSNQSVEDIISTLTRGAGTFKNFGLSLEESLAFITGIEKGGGDANKVIDAMRIGFIKLSQTNPDPTRAFARLAKDIANAETNAEAIRIAVDAFGARAGPVLAASIRQGRFEIDALVDSLSKGSDTISDARDETLSLTDRLAQLRTQFASNVGPVAQWVATVATIAAGAPAAAKGVQLLNTATGISVFPVTAAAGAFVGLAFGLDAVLEKLNEVVPAWGSFIETLLKNVPFVGGAFKIAFDAIDDLQDKSGEAARERIAGLVDMAAASTNAAFESAGLQVELANETAALNANTESIERNELARLATAEGTLGLLAQARSLNDAQRQLTETEQTLGRLRRNGKEDTQKYRDALRDQADQVLDVSLKTAQFKESQIELAREMIKGGATLGQVRRSLHDVADEANLTKEQTQSLIRDALEKIRPEYKTRVRQDGAQEAEEKVRNFRAELDRLHDVTVRLTVQRVVTGIASGVEDIGGSVGGQLTSPRPTSTGPTAAPRATIILPIAGKVLTQEVEMTQGENRIYLGGRRRYGRRG